MSSFCVCFLWKAYGIESFITMRKLASLFMWRCYSFLYYYSITHNFLQHNSFPWLKAKEAFLIEQVYPSFATTMTKQRDSIRRYLPHTLVINNLRRGELCEFWEIRYQAWLAAAYMTWHPIIYMAMINFFHFRKNYKRIPLYQEQIQPVILKFMCLIFMRS